MPSTPLRPRRAGPLAAALTVATLLSAAAAQPLIPPGAPVVTTLTTGEVIRGVLVARTAEAVVMDHPVLGRITLPAGSVQAMAADSVPALPLAPAAPPPPPADPAAEAPTEPPLGVTPAASPPSEELPAPKLSFFEGWSGSFDLGLFGSEGNTRRISLRSGLTLKRETEDTISGIDARYYYAREGGTVTDNKVRVDARNDWLPDEGSRIRPFIQGSFEYDDLQNWDFRISAFVGLGYEFVKTDRTLLIGRAGIGASREFGGSDNRIRPEALLGADLTHDINDRQKLSLTVDVFPDLADIGHYRINAKGAWEILLDESSKITLKVGFEDRYDSTPEGRRRNDLDYFAVIVIPF